MTNKSKSDETRLRRGIDDWNAERVRQELPALTEAEMDRLLVGAMAITEAELRQRLEAERERFPLLGVELCQADIDRILADPNVGRLMVAICRELWARAKPPLIQKTVKAVDQENDRHGKQVGELMGILQIVALLPADAPPRLSNARGAGQKSGPNYDRWLLKRLAEKHPEWETNDLWHAYETEANTEVSRTWIIKHKPKKQKPG